MKVVYTVEALDDLDGILAYTGSNYPNISGAFQNRLQAVVTRIGKWPESAQEVMRALVLLAAFLITLASPGHAADDVANAQSVIRSQEQAFSRDDAAAAYSYAAPGIRQMFPQADIFMFMVQHSYAPVYRHRSFEFGDAQVADGQVAQRVHIVDDNGEAWEALYTLEAQPDGSLKIIGCVLLKAGQGV
jgi:hypothetical protein